MSKPASESALGALHELVAKVLAERIANGELCTAADINAAIKFLKDNNITATPEGSDKLKELEEQVKGASLDVSDADAEELQRALDNVVNFPGSVAHA